MRILQGENEMRLYYRAHAEEVTLLRCETADRIVRLPNSIDGKPVRVLGDYALAARTPHALGDEVLCVRITCGGAQDIVHDVQAIEQIILPQDLRVIGSYAFYQCTRLLQLTLTDSVREVGGDCFMNCRSIAEIDLTLRDGHQSCLRQLLAETARELTAVLHFPEGWTARLLFPTYQEELEELSAPHIFRYQIHGGGYAYRQCFEDGVLRLSQYDMALSRLLETHDFDCAVRIALNRLRTPVELGAQARAQYLDCLHTHAALALRVLLAARDHAGLTYLLSLGIVPADALQSGCDTARAARDTESLGILLGAQTRRTAVRTKSYDL